MFNWKKKPESKKEATALILSIKDTLLSDNFSYRFISDGPDGDFFLLKSTSGEVELSVFLWKSIVKDILACSNARKREDCTFLDLKYFRKAISLVRDPNATCEKVKGAGGKELAHIISQEGIAEFSYNYLESKQELYSEFFVNIKM